MLLTNKSSLMSSCDKKQNSEAIITRHCPRYSNKTVEKLLKKLAVPCNTIFNVVWHYKETGSTADRPWSGQPRSVQTPQAIKRTPKRTAQTLSTASKRLLKRRVWALQACSEWLRTWKWSPTRGWGSCSMRSQRLPAGKEAKFFWIVWYLAQRARILFTDEKLFTIKAKQNSQNVQILAQRADEIPVEVFGGVLRKQKPASVMIWAGVVSEGKKTPFVFVPKGIKINQETYLDIAAVDSPKLARKHQIHVPARWHPCPHSKNSPSVLRGEFSQLLEKVHVATLKPWSHCHGLLHLVHPWGQGLCQTPCLCGISKVLHHQGVELYLWGNSVCCMPWISSLIQGCHQGQQWSFWNSVIWAAE